MLILKVIKMISFKLIDTGRIFRRFQSNLIPEIRIVKIVLVIKRVKAMALKVN